MRLFSTGLTMLVLLVLTGCAVPSGQAVEQEQVKVHCPACGTDLDALFYKKY